jgi:hypothetical protein
MCKIIFLKSLLLLKLFDNLSFSVGLSVIWMMLPRVILTLQLVDIFKDNQENDLDCFASNLNVSDTSLLGLLVQILLLRLFIDVGVAFGWSVIL